MVIKIQYKKGCWGAKARGKISKNLRRGGKDGMKKMGSPCFCFPVAVSI